LWEYKPEPFLKIAAERVFVGKSTNEDGGDEEDGNSMLIERSNDYVFVGDKVFSFKPLEPIVQFFSPVGNNEVPYPYAVDGRGRTYLLNENVVLEPDFWRDYDEPYEAYYDKHPTGGGTPGVERFESVIIRSPTY
jgi:hypothetical protein